MGHPPQREAGTLEAKAACHPVAEVRRGAGGGSSIRVAAKQQH